MEQFYVRNVLPDAIDMDDAAGTADLLVLPYNREAPIIEAQPSGRVVRYTEVMLPGCAERAIRGGAGRLPFTYGHSDSFIDRMGVATKLWDTAEGLRATVRFDRSKVDAVRDALESSHSGVSVAFHSLVPRAFTERDGSTVERRSIRIMHIAAVPNPAYSDARVLAVRNLAEDDDAEQTAAEKAYAEEQQRAARLLEEALSLVESGKRWEQFRG